MQEGEKRISDDVRRKIVNFLSSENMISSLNIYDERKIINEIGFDDLNALSKIRIPLIIQLNLKDSNHEIDLEKLIKKVCQISNVVGADINELAPIKKFDSYNFLVAKLAYKILAYSFEFKR